MATDKEDVVIFMIEELTKLVKQSSKSPQLDLSKVETLTVMMQSNKATSTRPPTIRHS